MFILQRYRMGWTLACLIACGMAQSAHAEGITLEQAIQSALSSHPAVLAKLSSSHEAQSNLDSAKWQRYPTPSVEATKQRDGSSTSLLRLQQPIWAGGRISAGIDAAGLRVGAADMGVEEVRLDVAIRVIDAFTETQHQQERELAARNAVNEHEKLVTMMNNRVEHEVSAPVDLNFAQSRLLQANNDLSSVLQSRQNAISQLSQLIGMAVSELAGEVKIAEAPQSSEAALESAYSYSPALRRLTLEASAAEQDVEIRRSVYMPRLSARLEHTNNTAYNFPPDNRAMLVLEWQPGAGLSSLSDVDAASSRRETVRHQIEAAKHDISDRISWEWNSLISAQLRLENVLQGRTLATQVSESYTRQYVAGRKSWIELLNAVREAAQADFAVADAKSQVVTAALHLRLLTGNLADYLVKSDER